MLHTWSRPNTANSRGVAASIIGASGSSRALYRRVQQRAVHTAALLRGPHSRCYRNDSFSLVGVLVCPPRSRPSTSRLPSNGKVISNVVWLDGSLLLIGEWVRLDHVNFTDRALTMRNRKHWCWLLTQQVQASDVNVYDGARLSTAAYLLRLCCSRTPMHPRGHILRRLRPSCWLRLAISLGHRGPQK